MRKPWLPIPTVAALIILSQSSFGQTGEINELIELLLKDNHRVAANEAISKPSSAPGNERQRRMDYSRRDIDKQDFYNENLRNADFSGARITDSYFDGSVAENTNFSNAKLFRVSFRGANLKGANFLNVETSSQHKIVWVNANLMDANLAEIELILVGCPGYYSLKALEIASPRTMAAILDFNNGHLTFRGATLRNAIICGDLTGVDFRGADLRGADFTNTTNASKGFFNRAKYDSRTRLPIDPEQHRMQREDDGPIASRDFVGEWLVDLSADPSKPEKPTLLLLSRNREYRWSSGNMVSKTINGSWDIQGQNVVVQGGEGNEDWVISIGRSASGASIMRLRSSLTSRQGFGIRNTDGGSK